MGIVRESMIKLLVPEKSRLTIDLNKEQDMVYESALLVMQHRPKLLLIQEEILQLNNLKETGFKIDYTQYNQLLKPDYIQTDRFNEYCKKNNEIKKRTNTLINRIQSIYYHRLHNHLNQHYRGYFILIQFKLSCAKKLSLFTVSAGV